MYEFTKTGVIRQPDIRRKMTKNVLYKTQGTCSQFIEIEADENKIITKLTVFGGCNGNLKGIAALAVGMRLDELKNKFRGITCGSKSTSCPDQISRAAEQLEKEYDK